METNYLQVICTAVWTGLDVAWFGSGSSLAMDLEKTSCPSPFCLTTTPTFARRCQTDYYAPAHEDQ